MNDNVMSGVGLFLAIYAVGIASWVVAVILHRRARQYYRGPAGWAQIRNPFSRYMPRNYTTDGVTLLRRQYVCMGIFTIACLVGLVIARIKTRGHL